MVGHEGAAAFDEGAGREGGAAAGAGEQVGLGQHPGCPARGGGDQQARFQGHRLFGADVPAQAALGATFLAKGDLAGTGLGQGLGGTDARAGAAQGALVRGDADLPQGCPGR